MVELAKSTTKGEEMKFMLYLSAVAMLAVGCAHVATVAGKCEGTVTPALVDVVEGALQRDDYTSALVSVTAGVAPCLVMATVEEIVNVLSTSKAAFTPQSEVVLEHGKAWFSAHGGAK
jgi:hypothetical protein